jgi:hypothetical protein
MNVSVDQESLYITLSGRNHVVMNHAQDTVPSDVHQDWLESISITVAVSALPTLLLFVQATVSICQGVSDKK